MLCGLRTSQEPAWRKTPIPTPSFVGDPPGHFLLPVSSIPIQVRGAKLAEQVQLLQLSVLFNQIDKINKRNLPVPRSCLAHSAKSPQSVMYQAGKRLALYWRIWFHPFDVITENTSAPLWMSIKNHLKNHPHKEFLRPLSPTRPGMPNPSSPPASQRSEVSPHGQLTSHRLLWQASAAVTWQGFSWAGRPGDF